VNLLLTGASGLIGSALGPFLEANGHRVIPLARRASAGSASGPSWNPETSQINLDPAGPLGGVIHLAGETIAQRWTAAAKSRIRQSRVGGTRLLCEGLARLAQPPKVLVCASATGFYGNRGSEVLDEQSGPGVGFLSDVCQEWEAAAGPARERGLRVVHLRLGIVLSARGGALKAMLPAFRFGLGGPVGRGDQYWSWIAMDDLLRVIVRAVTDAGLSGPVNAVAPEPVTSRDFARALGRAVRRPAMLRVPALAVKLLFGQMGREALLGGARVVPDRLLGSGFVFDYPQLAPALRHLLTDRSRNVAGS
jgi:uncharacterized protein